MIQISLARNLLSIARELMAARPAPLNMDAVRLSARLLAHDVREAALKKMGRRKRVFVWSHDLQRINE